jgi:hypothetical protein
MKHRVHMVPKTSRLSQERCATHLMTKPLFSLPANDQLVAYDLCIHLTIITLHSKSL